MILARSILLFSIRRKSTNGDADLFSINMKSANEIIPRTTKLAASIVELLSMELSILLPPLPVSKYVSTSRSDVIATASVIAPFISTCVLLVANLRLFASVVFPFINSELLLLSSGSVSCWCCCCCIFCSCCSSILFWNKTPD